MAKARNTASARPKRKPGQQSRPTNRASTTSQTKSSLTPTKGTDQQAPVAQNTDATARKTSTTLSKESTTSLKEAPKEPTRKASTVSSKETARKAATATGKKPVRRGPTVRRQSHTGLYTVIGVLVLIALVIGAFVLLQRWQAGQQASNAADSQPAADPVVLQQLTGVSQATWEGIGTGGVSNPLKSTTNQPPLKGPNGHPEFFYVGAEYCPFCAGERWSMINALSRFGTFKNLSQIVSAESHISTFSFYRSSYTSNYIDFVPVEVNGNQLDSSGQQYVPLQQLTSAQQQTFNTYDNAPYFQSSLAFPFIDIGNRYLAQGGSFQPTVLLDSSQNTLSWQDIASSLSNPSSPIAQNILGTANYLTAAICQQTNQQPGNVCNSPTIQKIEQSLNTALVGTSPTAFTLSPLDTIGVQRRLD